MMNKLKYSFWLLLPFLFGCGDEESDIGLQFQDNALLNSTLIDTFTVESSTSLEYNNLFSKGTSTLLVGRYVDNNFGTVKSSSFFQVLPANQNLSFGTNPVVDSVRIKLRYAVDEIEGQQVARITGDPNKPSPVSVLEITEDFEDTKNYVVSDELAIGQLLGSQHASASPTPLTNNNTYISLPNSYGERIITNASGNTANFLAEIKGLALLTLSPNDAESVIAYRADSSSRVEVYYHNDESPSGFRLDLNIGTNRFNQITSDRAGTPINSLTSVGDQISSSSTNNKIFLQSSTGVRGLLRFPTLDKFIASKGKEVIVDRAEIILHTDQSITGSYFNLPPYALAVFRTDENGSLLTADDGSVSPVSNEAFLLGDMQQNIFAYDFEKNAYIMNVTSYFQDIMLGQIENTPLLLAPAYDGRGVSRTLLFGAESSEQPIEFRLYLSSQN